VRGRGLFGLALLSLVAGGCASVREAFDFNTPAAQKPGASAEEMAAAFRAQAGQHERDGQLRPAVEDPGRRRSPRPALTTPRNRSRNSPS
jgi:hypothetical protein